jgi:uncharacterized protein (UPF0548 family)
VVAPRRLVAAALWPFGIGLTSWHYMWRTTPLHRGERPGSPDCDGPPPLPDGVPTSGLQPADRGVGTLFHRRYRVRVHDPKLSAEELIGRIGADLNSVAPTEFARFTKVSGEDGALRVGDELVVRMPGPWDGPVRVVEVTPASFRFATLDGHLEAGQIEFRAATEDGRLTFTIESWARSGDRLSKVLYGRLRMAKEVQLHMWTSFLERIAGESGGRAVGGIRVDTWRVDDDGVDGRGGDTSGERLLGDRRARDVLDRLHRTALNFDLNDRERFTADHGWHVDDHCQPLPPEPPGPPLPGGSWEVARRLVADYEFADPDIVRAVYYPDRPLESREMVLVARFHGLRFRLGVRVGGVRDEVTVVGGRDVRVWGWNYRTLEGHLEMGQIDFEVWKWLDSGDVEFRIRAFSRRAAIANPVVRVGFRVFGRREQLRFARNACARMARLTEAALRDESADDVPRVADVVTAGPAPDGPG